MTAITHVDMLAIVTPAIHWQHLHLKPLQVIPGHIFVLDYSFDILFINTKLYV